MNALLFVLIASLCGLSNALALPVVSRSAQESRSPWQRPSILAERSMKVYGFLADAGNDNVVNFQDTVYATNMTLGGQTFLVQLDTGSADLWVQLPTGQIQYSNVTNINATETYGKGAVAGPIALASASIGPHTVPNQAFINSTNATDFDTIFNYDVRGIIGLGFDQDSTVDIDILESFGTNTTAGSPFLYQIFLQNTSAPPVFTVLLGRAADQKTTTEGIFTIAEYDPQYASVVDQPQLPRYPNSQDINTPNRWSVIMDGMSVNGNPYAFNTSGVPGVPEGSVVAVLDTGFSFPPLPKTAVDFIYSSIQGATFDNTSGLWIVPCENATTVEFTFGNKTVPIHPLDLTTITQLNNQTVCVNTFRPTTFPINPQFDVIMGDAFLKNAYVSFNFGDFVNNHSAIPFVQILPTTDLGSAFAEFNQARKVEFSAAQASASALASPSASVPVSDSASASESTSMPAAVSATPSVPACSAPVSASATSVPTDSSSPSSMPAPSSASYPGWSSYGPSSSIPTDSDTSSPSATPTSCSGDSSVDLSCSASPSSTSAPGSDPSSPSGPSDPSTPTTPTAPSTPTDPSSPSSSPSDPSAGPSSSAGPSDPSSTSDPSSPSDPSTRPSSSAGPSDPSSVPTSSSGPSDPSSGSTTPSDLSSGSDNSDTPMGLTPDMGFNPGSMPGDKRTWARREMQYLARRQRATQPVPARKPITAIPVISFVPVLEMYGAIVVSLICGAVVVSLVMFAVGIVLVVRSWSRSQSLSMAQYSVARAKGQTEADPEADCLSSPHYYYDDC
ncbi:hypothetical protein SCP_0905200 [Sparassis crispa]|uniref:Peptidase A1 domain-containing protein n=1 Tax=Sparassis crispa TaxID=139825 RepID=A0A401GWS2_9APHY|nr:hypothetical protein SCP_0905200 [Sparassis crispa]GBE86640.1 hypothetical protein SCP_0905200 [Sparassis crispa]